MSSGYSIAIVGATGAVGVEMLRVLERRNFPIRDLRLLASPRSAGRQLEFRGAEHTVQALTANSFEGMDVVLFSAGGSTAKKYAPVAVSHGALVVDNSSAFRMDEQVPLVIPEINADAIGKHHRIIANPNCTTAIAMMGLFPLHRLFRVERVIASSYQAVSGSGARAIEELKNQVSALASGREVTKEVYPHQIAFNVIPEVDEFLPSGYTREEMKLQNEGRRILHAPEFRASVTCVRVPVYRAHAVAVTAQFRAPVDLDSAREAIERFPGVRLHDDPEQHVYPLPLECAGEDDCRVGRLRNDCALDNAITFWVAGDQLLKGAALNAVQIAETALGAHATASAAA